MRMLRFEDADLERDVFAACADKDPKQQVQRRALLQVLAGLATSGWSHAVSLQPMTTAPVRARIRFSERAEDDGARMRLLLDCTRGERHAAFEDRIGEDDEPVRVFVRLARLALSEIAP